MLRRLNGRVAVLAGLASMAVAGVVLAQCNEQLGAMGSPAAGQLRLQVTLTDGQTIVLNCAHVDVQFSSGGQMRVADSGAMPLSAGLATAPPVTEPPLPPVYEEAATFNIYDRGESPLVPRLPGTPPTHQVHGILGPPELYGTTIPAPGTEPTGDATPEPVNPPFEDSEGHR